MLEGLSKINWEKIRHRHGSAADVPPLLYTLVLKDKTAQKKAIQDLFSHVWDHGKVYEATARVVPFLYEVLENPACLERFSVLWLLSSIATVTFREDGLHEDRPEMIWAKNAQMAVRQGVKGVLKLLNDPEKDLRLPAILLLVALPEEAAQIKPALLSVLSVEKNPDIRAALGLALALLGLYHVGAFDAEIKKTPIALADDLSKACLQNKKMTWFACETIQQCFMETLEPPNRDWLRDYRGLLDNQNLD